MSELIAAGCKCPVVAPPDCLSQHVNAPAHVGASPLCIMLQTYPRCVPCCTSSISWRAHKQDGLQVTCQVIRRRLCCCRAGPEGHKALSCPARANQEIIETSLAGDALLIAGVARRVGLVRGAQGRWGGGDVAQQAQRLEDQQRRTTAGGLMLA